VSSIKKINKKGGRDDPLLDGGFALYFLKTGEGFDFGDGNRDDFSFRVNLV